MALFIGMALYLLPLEPSIVSLQFSFTESDFKWILGRWQTAGVCRFKAHFAADFPFLVCYGLFGYVLVARTNTLNAVAPRLKSLLIWTMPAAAMADIFENILQLRLLDIKIGLSPIWYAALGAAATVKWLLLVLFVLTLLFSRFKGTKQVPKVNQGGDNQMH
jgi:hypothetical protein